MTEHCPYCGQEMSTRVARFDGDKFRRLRTQLGISLREVEIRTGLRPALVSSIERGIAGAAAKTRLQLAEVVGVDVEHFVKRD